jgi:hypothetical protein
MSVGIRLFHGRRNPKEELEDWGEDGPVLGPFDGIHSTYLHHIRPVVQGDSEVDLEIVEDMLYYDGVYYGDWTVLSWDLAQKEYGNILQPLDPEKCKVK